MTDNALNPLAHTRRRTSPCTVHDSASQAGLHASAASGLKFSDADHRLRTKTYQGRSSPLENCDHTGRINDAHEPVTQHRFETLRLRPEPMDSHAVAVQTSQPNP